MEKSKRFIDILPPKRARAEKPKASTAKFPRPVIAAALLVLLLGGGALSLQVFFAKATVAVWPHIKKVELQADIIAKTSQEAVSLEDKTIPATLFEQEKSLTRLFPASGSKLVETHAKGVITVFNKRDVSQILVANTRFVSEDGRLFRLQERVLVPPASGNSPGSLNVSVAAAEGGPEYNIATSNFSLPGLAGSPLYTLIYGKSEQEMTGGSKIQQPVVTQSDIEQAKEILLEDVTKLANNALLLLIPTTYTVSDESMARRVLEVSTPVKEGASLQQFSVTAKVRSLALVFQQKDLEALSHELLKETLAEKERINKDTFHSLYTVRTIDLKSKSISLQGDISSVTYVDPSFDELSLLLLGKKKGEAEAILIANPAVARFKLSLRPFWLQEVPKDVVRLTLVLLLDE